MSLSRDHRYVTTIFQDSSLYIGFMVMTVVFAFISMIIIFFESIKTPYFSLLKFNLNKIGAHIKFSPVEVKSIWREIHCRPSARALYRRYLVLRDYKDKEHGKFTFKSRAPWIPPRFLITPWPLNQ